MPCDLSPNKRFALNVLVPSVYFVPLAMAYFSPKHFGFGIPWLVELGLGVGALGVVLWIVSTINLGRSLAVLPQADRLVTRGVYKYCRHPMYLGITLTLFGLLLACGSTFGMIYLLVVVLPLNLVRIRLEEKTLAEKFGADYHAYRKTTFC
ncbi:MAG: methyltransferase family protein [Nitrospinales bacterium]